MERVISLSLGEVMLKGKNRRYFIDKIVSQVKRSIKDIGFNGIYKDMGKIYIEADYEKFDQIISRVSHVFGVIYISPCIKVKREFDDFKAGVLQATEDVKLLHPEYKTFKAHTKRADKRFHLNSMQINSEIGGIILKNTEYRVDVHNPDFYLYCDVKDDVYIYTERFKGHGGLPRGTNGRGLLLLSGGIDSPVAGFLMAKRGVEIDALHFHSYPFTSERAEEKVHNLAKILCAYTGNMNIYSINILPIQKEINKNCPEEEMTIISRRFMMRIAQRISEINGYNSIITGENLGQVASQTIDGLTVTDSVVKVPAFRPLIGMDKVDIIEWAKKIGTYETSILPFEDCCTVFLPKHPSLRPTIKQIDESESVLDIEKLVEDAISSMKIIKIKEEN